MELGKPLVEAGGRDWVYEQLRAAGYEHTSVWHLIDKALDALQPYADEIKRTDGDVANITRASLVLATLLTGREIPEAWWSPEKQAERTHTWVKAMPRMLNSGDVVRVRPDAYLPGNPLYTHNGREGVVQAIRNGVIVGYGTGNSKGLGTRHQFDKLDRRVMIQSRSSGGR